MPCGSRVEACKLYLPTRFAVRASQHERGHYKLGGSVNLATFSTLNIV